MKAATSSLSGRPALALLWLLLSASSLPSFTSAQSAAELLALASRGEGSVTLTKTKTGVAPPVDLSLVSYKTGTDADDDTDAADANAQAGDEAHVSQPGNTTVATPNHDPPVQGEMTQVPADVANSDPSYNTTEAMPDKPSISIAQVPGDMVDVTDQSENVTVITTIEQIDDSSESAHVVSPDSYRTSGSISYLLRGRRRQLAKRRR